MNSNKVIPFPTQQRQQSPPQQQEQEIDNRPLILTYSDYSKSHTGLSKQMNAIMPQLRKEFRVVEFAIGANELHVFRERQKGNTVIPTQDTYGRSDNDQYYGQKIMDSVLQYHKQEDDLPKLAFINHDITGLITISEVLKKYKIPIIYWCLFDNDYMWAYIQQALSIPDRIIYQTNYARNTVRSKCPYLDGPVIYPSVDSEWLSRVDATKLLAKDNPEFLGKISGKKIIFFIGKNQERKNIAALLDAIALLQAEGRKDVYLMLHTIAMKQEIDGIDTNQIDPEALEIEMYARSIGLNSDNIGIANKIMSDKMINLFYQLADVVCIPSCSEGFGMIWLEAFQKEKPCIGINYSATGEVLGDGRGLLVEPVITIFKPSKKVRWAYATSKDIAKAIVDVIDRKVDIDMMTSKGKTFLAEYNRIKQANKLIEEFKTVIDMSDSIINQLPLQTIVTI